MFKIKDKRLVWVLDPQKTSVLCLVDEPNISSKLPDERDLYHVHIPDLCTTWPAGAGRGVVGFAFMEALLDNLEKIAAKEHSLQTICRCGLNRSRLAAHLYLQICCEKGTEARPIDKTMRLPVNADFVELVDAATSAAERSTTVRDAVLGKVDELIGRAKQLWAQDAASAILEASSRPSSSQ